jgi:hypothetical protein
VFGARARLGGRRGLIVTIALVLILANVFDLTAIASIGSAVALTIFVIVGAAALRLRDETGSQAAVILLGIAMTAVVLVLFAIDTLRNEPQTFVAMAGLAVLAVALDLAWTWYRDHVLDGPPDSVAAQAPSDQGFT